MSKDKVSRIAGGHRASIKFKKVGNKDLDKILKAFMDHSEPGL